MRLALCALLGSLLVPAAAVAAAQPITYSGPAGRVALDGPWELRSDHTNTGIEKGWGKGGFFGSEVTVPNATNANPDRLRGHRAVRAWLGTIAWYRTKFTVPRPGHYAIDFQSVNHRATVWIDGKRIGRSHVGEFQPFAKHFRARTKGPHLLVVRADYRDPEGQKAFGWHRTWFNFGGIAREVTVRPVGKSDITAPTVNTTIGPKTGDAIVVVTARVRNYGRTRSIPLAGTLTHGDQRVAIPFGAHTVAAGKVGHYRALVRVPEPALWSPEAPNLYDLDLQVAGEAQWRARTGLRQLTWEGRRILLNGRRILLKGASLHEDAYEHGDALVAEDMDKLVEDLQALHANVTRNHHPLSPALLERLDAAGIMVWQEVGPNDSPGGWRTDTPTLRAQSRTRVRESFAQLQWHPSIIIWSLGNELAGEGHDGGQPQWVSGMARELHRRDPGRMVGADIWGTHVPSSDAGLLVYRDLDVVGLTNYDGWYNDHEARGARLRAIVHRSVDQFARAFGDKVLLVTEFGAEANGQNAPGDPGSYGFQAQLLREHLRVYAHDPKLAGMLIWILRDYALTPGFAGGSIKSQIPGIKLVRGMSQKGLFDYRGRSKPSFAPIARLMATFRTRPPG